MKTGKFITFEGNECAGKSTQINMLGEYLESVGYKVRIIREPGGTGLAEEIRTMVKAPRTETVYPETELCLFQAARSQLVREVIKPALAEGMIVLSDRFYDSTWVYQGWVGGINTLMIEMTNKLSTGGLAIDRTFLLDLPLDVIQARLAARGNGSACRFDNKGAGFFQKVNEGYNELFKVYKHRIERINACQTKEVIQQELMEKVQKIIL